MTLAAAAAAPAAQAQAPAPGTSAAPAGGPKGREQRMLIVDAQIHIWKSSKPNPNHRQIADYSADDALKEMDEAGVTAAVIHPPVPTRSRSRPRANIPTGSRFSAISRSTGRRAAA
jgi:hypothetical protein